MCIHCCRLRQKPCPRIPYSCPHCPVRTISSISGQMEMSRRSSGENPFLIKRPVDPPSDPGDSLPKRWLEVNRRVIYALAKKMNRSPEAAHYAVLLLLYANYEKMIMKRPSFREQDLCSNRRSLFNSAGFLCNPMAPETLGKLLRMLQDYITRLRQLNNRFNWYANGEDREEILCMLGEQDELVRLLRELFGDSHVVSIPQLLRALQDLDFNSLFGKFTAGKSPWPVKSISKLYSEVVDPYKSKKHSYGGCKTFENQIQEVTINTIISPKKPQEYKENKKRDTELRKPKQRERHRRGNNEQLIKVESVFSKPGGRSGKPRERHRKGNVDQLKKVESMFSKGAKGHRDNDEAVPNKPLPEMPRLFFEPFDSRKSSTWQTRYSVVDRLLPDNRIDKRRVRHYSNTVMDEQQELDRPKDSSFVQSEKEYGDMFGQYAKEEHEEEHNGDIGKSLADR